MRCSSSEARLDAYVEGTLAPRDRARIAAHVATCPGCTSLLEEFRVIDALLLTPRALEPAPNFTFKAMAEIRSLPPPHVHRLPTLAVLGTYIVFAWITIGAFLIFARGTALAALAAIELWFTRLGAGAATVARATGHVLGARSFELTTAMAAVLAVDAAAAALVFGVYALLRARRTAAIGDIDPC